MTDPNDENFIFPPGMSDEDKDKVRAMIMAQHDNQAVFKHRVSHFFEGLDEEQLSVLRDIFAGIGKKNIGALDYYQGIMTMMLVQKHDYCLACGSKHGDELQDLLKAAAAEQEASQAEEQDDQPRGSWKDVVIDPELAQNLAKYRVNLVTNEYPKVACVDCGMPYPSLADRMVNPPDHCSGCFVKASHG